MFNFGPEFMCDHESVIHGLEHILYFLLSENALLDLAALETLSGETLHLAVDLLEDYLLIAEYREALAHRKLDVRHRRNQEQRHQVLLQYVRLNVRLNHPHPVLTLLHKRQIQPVQQHIQVIDLMR